MSIRYEKIYTTPEDFEARKEKAIQLIANKQFIASKRVKYYFTEKQLREEFIFDDADKFNDKYDNLFFDGNFVIFPLEKLILV